MKEILILSGKGGTGKTTLTGSLAVLLGRKVIADCDVDAADLHLILAPRIEEVHEFWCGVKAEVDQERCTGCGTCQEVCRFDAVELGETSRIDGFSCEGCGVCAAFCPEEAIALKDNLSGSWFRSTTDHGPMIHAQLHIGEENSGKLVAQVKREARKLAEDTGVQWILVDGPPGIGCPVIASLSGTDLVLAVTEPTRSGLHDLERVIDLAGHFKVPVTACINKWDLNQEMSDDIEKALEEKGVPLVGKIPFDQAVVESIVAGRPLVGYSSGPAAQAIRAVADKLDRWDR